MWRQRPEEGFRVPVGLRLTGGCESPSVGAENYSYTLSHLSSTLCYSVLHSVIQCVLKDQNLKTLS